MATPSPEMTRKALLENIDNLGIKYDELKQPPFWAPLCYVSHKTWKLQVATRIAEAAQRAGRPLAQEEKDAIAQHYARAISWEPYDSPVSLALAYGLYRVTAPQFRFPWGRPSMNLDKFPMWGLDGTKNPAEALTSRRYWAIARFASWWLVANIGVSIAVAVRSNYSYTANRLTDPRLRNYNHDVLARIRNPPPVQRVDQTGLRSKIAQGVQNPPMQQQSAFSERYSQDRQFTENQTTTPRPEAMQTSFDDDPFVFDDASPVAPEQQKSTQPQNAQPGSSWDRLRAQARAETTTQSRQNDSTTSVWERSFNNEATSQGAKRGTSYTFSTDDEANAYAKAQAQKEFDEMLERERKGDIEARR